MLDNPAAYSGRITGAVLVETMRNHLQQAGFVDIVFIDKKNSEEIIRNWNFGAGAEKAVASVYIKAGKLSA